MLQKIENLLSTKPVILQLLKFACIGALNTAVDFLILNFLTKSLDIQAGWALAVINTVGVGVAIMQSYYWNRSWAFATEAGISLLKQFIHLVLVGGLGFFAFVAVILGVGAGAAANYYGILLLAFVVVQVSFIITFHLKQQHPSREEFEKFVLVSLLGVAVNSLVLWLGVGVLLKLDLAFLTPDLAKNLAKFAAVFVSLVWNFIGYKFLVFKR